MLVERVRVRDSVEHRGVDSLAIRPNIGMKEYGEKNNNNTIAFREGSERKRKERREKRDITGSNRKWTCINITTVIYTSWVLFFCRRSGRRASIILSHGSSKPGEHRRQTLLDICAGHSVLNTTAFFLFFFFEQTFISFHGVSCHSHYLTYSRPRSN
ncbi:uncharacterized protein F4812DRAFT_279634 [Daldinia caldariorum]|uniref:uncharacterized protein n=1 Tax=Daldinia caldariorum TaxID=326644 RepID=UPI0020079FB4|nr:uncharacterized protein F4812DRAFT_279634 [Daldinia caldariorum]KAI1470807.1 hypothetical protein F4812DRAFT_279634 [Daldinia caldariorum]